MKRTSKPSYNAIITAGTDTYDTDVTSSPIAINNSDILIEIGTTSPSPSLYDGFTINYTYNADSGGSSVSKNWKFNGTSASVPQKTYSKYVDMPGESYNDTTFVANFDYIYYADDWSYITFGSAGFWDIRKNQYGKYGGNILKFNTEPSGELLAFLQAHAQPI